MIRLKKCFGGDQTGQDNVCSRFAGSSLLDTQEQEQGGLTVKKKKARTAAAADLWTTHATRFDHHQLQEKKDRSPPPTLSLSLSLSISQCPLRLVHPTTSCIVQEMDADHKRMDNQETKQAAASESMPPGLRKRLEKEVELRKTRATHLKAFANAPSRGNSMIQPRPWNIKRVVPDLFHAAYSGHPNAIPRLIQEGAVVDTKDSDGRTALSLAAESGHVGMVHAQQAAANEASLKMRLEELQRFRNTDTSPPRQCSMRSSSIRSSMLQHGPRDNLRDAAPGIPDLFHAARGGYLYEIPRLVREGAVVDAKESDGRTALSLAAEHGHAAVVRELIRYGAAVDSIDSKGRTALSYAAGCGRVHALQVLVNRGAAVDSKDRDGRAPLSYAAEAGHAGVAKELIRLGADKDAIDNSGRTALSYASLHRQSREVVHLLVDCDPIGGFPFSSHPVAFFVAAAVGDAEAIKNLIADGVSVDAATDNGRTPLFFSAQCGQTEVVRMLIQHGASVNAKSKSTQQQSLRESDTPLTVAGRVGHVKIFQELIEAGASVNVRGYEGETPLISAARWDLFAGVPSLIARGGALRFSSVAADEYPLIPGSLVTMRQMCGSTYEFKSMYARVLQRLQDIYRQLRQQDEAQVEKGALVSFTSILFRFCRLLFEIKKRRSPLSRFLGSRAFFSRMQDFHEELDHFVALLGLECAGKTWSDQWDNDQELIRLRFEELLRSDRVLLDGFDGKNQKLEAAVLLQYEIEARRREKGSSLQLETIQRVLDRFLRACGMAAPAVPEWFISRDDVEFYPCHLVESVRHIKLYKGKWRKTEVLIETVRVDTDKFVKAAARWFHLSHPNVVRLYGACHIGATRFLVYESVPDGKQLQEFLGGNTNLALKWKSLHEAALGLQYLHTRGVVHGDLRSENIIVGSDLVARLSGVHEYRSVEFGSPERSSLIWMAPERISKLFDYSEEVTTSISADIYAFGMCIWEAVTLEVPWKGTPYYLVRNLVSEGGFPERPASMTDAEWSLITRMCASDPSERVGIEIVVNQLKQFVYDSEQTCKTIVHFPDVPRANLSTQAQRSIDEHAFAELDGSTIPNTLQAVRARCEAIQDNQWMLNIVCPALEFIFDLLRERKKSPADIEVVRFCEVLSRFQRYLRVAVSEKSVYQLIRSRQVAESHQLVYAALDRLLDMLEVPETDSIRVWKRESDVIVDTLQVNLLTENLSDPGFRQQQSESPCAVSLKYFDTPASSHELWTIAGLAASLGMPSWYLPLQDLVFSEYNQIGQGSFGAVYKGSWLDTPVVIKFMGYEEDFDTISTDLLLHEVRVWHRLNQPHVLKLYGACHVDKRYFVCEFASNGDLRDYLKKPGNEHLKWQKMYEAALGLQYLHDQNITHNDLKCDNIMVGTDNKAKLIDFGLSCLLDEAEIQIDEKKMGAVHWKSPEYLAGGRPSCASDVYSFAMCILEVVSGDVPWGKSVIAPVVRYRVKRGGIPNLPDAMNEKQRNLIQLMTKFEPLERVKMGFVVDKLHEIVQEEKSTNIL